MASTSPAAARSAAGAPGNALLPKRATGLPRDSVANASQITTVNKADLLQLAGTVPTKLLQAVSTGVRWFLEVGSSVSRLYPGGKTFRCTIFVDTIF